MLSLRIPDLFGAEEAPSPFIHQEFQIAFAIQNRAPMCTLIASSLVVSSGYSNDRSAR